MNSMEPPTSPYYFKPIEGFYYGYLNPESCYGRFEWTKGDFDYTLKPAPEFLDLMNGLHIPVYGDIKYER